MRVFAGQNPYDPNRKPSRPDDHLAPVEAQPRRLKAHLGAIALPKHLAIRPRRLRSSAARRAWTQETDLHPSDLVSPLFIHEGAGRHAVSSLPGVYQLSIEEALREVEALAEAGVLGVDLFGVSAEKDVSGRLAYDENGLIQRAIAAIKKRFGEAMLVITDVCLCGTLEHGHCGLVRGERVLNDESVAVLAQVARSHAEAGADVVSPSDMMDGRVAAIREALDAANQHDVAILAYSAKYASAFYGPFRQAAESAPQFGDRQTYQMNPANAREALREIELDVQEAADIVMVKPALLYLDVIARARPLLTIPLAAYHVSGEYAMLMAAAERGWLERDRSMAEVLLSIKRAGADIIFSYFARRAAELLRTERFPLPPTFVSIP